MSFLERLLDGVAIAVTAIQGGDDKM